MREGREMGGEGRKRRDGKGGWEGERVEREGEGKGRGGERGGDMEGPGNWYAPRPALALGGPTAVSVCHFIAISQVID